MPQTLKRGDMGCGDKGIELPYFKDKMLAAFRNFYIKRIIKLRRYTYERY